jgi:hypothetical protein
MPKFIGSNFRQFAQATFDNLEVGEMGVIFPVAPLAVRRGVVRNRKKEACRSARLRERASVLGVSNGAGQGLPVAPCKPSCTPFQRNSCRRKREAKQNAEACRLKEDMAVSGAFKDLLKAIRESVGSIARVPKDEWGQVHVYGFTEDGEEIPSFEKTSRVFKRFTCKEAHALYVTTRKYRAAARRLTASVAAAWSLWEATLAEYKCIELTGSATTAGGHL